jgi:signal transduction histidine kinase
MKIFNKFYRSKDAILMNPNGMGLKLYLSRTIIKRHKGEIYLESSGKDKGTIAYIKLPLAKK